MNHVFVFGYEDREEGFYPEKVFESGGQAQEELERMTDQVRYSVDLTQEGYTYYMVPIQRK